MMVLVVVSVSIIEFNLIQLLPQNHESCDPNNGGGVYNHILQWPKCVCVCVFMLCASMFCSVKVPTPFDGCFGWLVCVCVFVAELAPIDPTPVEHEIICLAHEMA